MFKNSNTNKYLWAGMAICLLSICLVGCDLSKNDPCADTIAEQVNFDLHITVKTYYETIFDDPVPLNNCILDISVYKKLCEGETKGLQTFSDAHTGDDNVYQISGINYSLHNTEDAVVIKVVPKTLPLPPDDNLINIDFEDKYNYIFYEYASEANGDLNHTVEVYFTAQR